MFSRHFHKSPVVNEKLLLDKHFSNKAAKWKLRILQKLL